MPEIMKQVDKVSEEQEVTDATKGELGGFLETLTTSLKTELETKLGKDNPRSEAILQRVGDLQKVGMGLHIRSAINTVMGFFGFAKKFKPDLQLPGGLEDMSTKASTIGDQFDELQEKFSPEKLLAQFSGGADQQAILAQMGIETGNTTTNSGIDLAFQDFETKMTALKKQKGITVALYQAGYTQLLQNFIGKVKTGGETPIPKKDTEAVHKNATVDAGGNKKPELSHEEENKRTEVINDAKKYIKYPPIPYVRGGTSDNGMDCSGFLSKVLKKEYAKDGEEFDRLTAKGFHDKDGAKQDIKIEDVKPGDFMYWEDTEGKKYSSVYHIELVVGEPFQEKGKWMVKTIGAATSKNVLDDKDKPTSNSGVGYRIREFDPSKHDFGKPTYYQDLVKLDNKDKNNEEV